jgi:hypothetical protein
MTSGGAGNRMGGGGGRGIPMCISTAAIVGIGTTITNAKSVVPKSIFFILLPPLLIKKWPSVPHIFKDSKSPGLVTSPYF